MEFVPETAYAQSQQSSSPNKPVHDGDDDVPRAATMAQIARRPNLTDPHQLEWVAAQLEQVGELCEEQRKLREELEELSTRVSLHEIRIGCCEIIQSLARVGEVLQRCTTSAPTAAPASAAGRGRPESRAAAGRARPPRARSPNWIASRSARPPFPTTPLLLSPRPRPQAGSSALEAAAHQRGTFLGPQVPLGGHERRRLYAVEEQDSSLQLNLRLISYPELPDEDNHRELFQGHVLSDLLAVFGLSADHFLEIRRSPYFKCDLSPTQLMKLGTAPRVVIIKCATVQLKETLLVVWSQIQPQGRLVTDSAQGD